MESMPQKSQNSSKLSYNLKNKVLSGSINKLLCRRQWNKSAGKEEWVTDRKMKM
jgi:hypothetical protein